MIKFYKKYRSKQNDSTKALIKSIHSETRYIYGPNDLSKSKTYQEIRAFDEHLQKALVIQLLEENKDVLNKRAKTNSTTVYNNKQYEYYAGHVIEAVVTGVLRRI